MLARQLVESIVKHNHHLSIHLVMVNQVGTLLLKGNDLFKISVINTEGKMSLSKARNRAITYLTQHSLNADYVFYPDDDTTFDEVFFRDFDKYIHHPNAYLIRVLNEDDHGEYKNFNLRDGEILKPEHATLAISYNMVIPFPLFEKVGYFDEKLGVGAEFGSSEDLDYFIRCQQLRDFKFVKHLYCFHPSREAKYNQMSIAQIGKRFEKYSEGYLFVMFRYGYWTKIMTLPFRTLGGVALSLLRLKLPWAWEYLLLFFKRWSIIFRFSVKKINDPKFFE